MVLFQNVPTVKSSVISKSQFKESPSQNSNTQLNEFINNKSFSKVTLFLKFIQEDYFTYGNLSIFKSYFEKNCNDHIWKNNRLGQAPEQKNNSYQYSNLEQIKEQSNLDKFQFNYEKIIHNFFGEETQTKYSEELNRVSWYLMKYNHAISALIKEPNIVLETAYCHTQTQFNFLNELDFDIQKLTIHKNFSYYYYIQEVSGNNNTYGIFVYFRFEKFHLVFYNPHSELNEFSSDEYPIFKETFNSIIHKYGKNYCSFRLKLQSVNKTIPINEESLISILNLSANNFTDYLQNKKTKYLKSLQKEEVNFCQNILKNSNATSSSAIANIFFIKYSEIIQKIKRNYETINEKSFWIFFLINYLSCNDEFANFNLNKLDPKLEPKMGKVKIFDFILNYFNKKITSSHIKHKKNLCLVIIEVYKHISVCDFRTPFYGNILQFSINKNHFDVAKLFFESFDFDLKQTVKNWNIQNLIYNEKYISKRFNGTYLSLIGFSFIGKLEIAPLNIENPTERQLEHHFLTATGCYDQKLTEFCLGTCNQTHILGLGQILKSYFSFDPLSYEIEFDNHYIFVHKICPNVYDFMVVFYIDKIIENEETKNLKNPIYFSYVFTLQIKNEKHFIKNFNIGYLNKTVSDKYSYEIKEKIIEALKDETAFNYYKSQGNKGKVFYSNI